jgi:phosphate-selective porin OprO and OprP
MDQLCKSKVCGFLFVCLLLFGGFGIAGTVSPEEETESGSIGVALEEQKVNIKIGGRVFGDWMWGSAEDAVEETFGSLVSGTEWRAAWIEISGDYGEKISFRVWYDVAGGEAVAKDVWLGFNDLPVGSLRLGHMKEPFSLEQLVSSKSTVFMERSLVNVFAPSRNNGIAVFGNDGSGRITWGAGVFVDADSQGNAKVHDDTYNFTARITGLPVMDKSMLLHLGAAYHLRSVQDGGSIRIRERPEAHLAYSMVDTGSFVADSVNMFGFEGALLTGRLLVQGEYVGAMVDSAEYDDPGFNGFYVFGSYFLTNDKHGYSKSSGTVGGVTPSNPFWVDGGTGAWEVALRYSQLDLDDDVVMGGVLKDMTLGINWYLNKYSRMMWNYIYADREDIGTANIFQMRYQFSF